MDNVESFLSAYNWRLGKSHKNPCNEIENSVSVCIGDAVCDSPTHDRNKSCLPTNLIHCVIAQMHIVDCPLRSKVTQSEKDALCIMMLTILDGFQF